jgi:hypothetical protein
MAQYQDQPSVDAGTRLDGTPFDDDRRKFLAACGKFAIVTPPALTVLLSTSLNSKAIAQSGGRDDRDHDRDHRGDRDHHHGDDDGFDWLEKWLGKLF